MFLLNAIYFKGSWRDRFDPANTRDAPFHPATGADQTAQADVARGQDGVRRDEHLPGGRPGLWRFVVHDDRAASESGQRRRVGGRVADAGVVAGADEQLPHARGQPVLPEGDVLVEAQDDRRHESAGHARGVRSNARRLHAHVDVGRQETLRVAAAAEHLRRDRRSWHRGGGGHDGRHFA